MVDVDRPGPAVEAEPVPVPQLEREDVRRRADLEHHRVLARAVDGAAGDEEVVVLLRRPPVDVALVGEGRSAAFLRAAQVARAWPRGRCPPSRRGTRRRPSPRRAGSSSRPACSASRSGPGCTRSAGAPGARGCRRPSCRGSRTGSGTRRRSARGPPRRAARAGGGRRGRWAGTSTRVGAEAEQQAVLLRHAVEAPGVVRRLLRQVADLLHPLPAPGAGVEERHDAEGPPRRGGQPAAEVVALDQLRRPGLVRVEQVVDPLEQRSLQAVGRPPVHEEAALVELARPLLLVVGPEARDLVPPLPLLDLPAREVGVDEDVRLRQEDGSRPHHEHQARGRLVDAAALDGRAGRVDEVGDRQAVHAPEDGVVAEEGRAQALDLGRVLVRLPGVDHEGGAEAVREHPAHLVHVDAGIALDGEHAARAGAQALEALEDRRPADLAGRRGAHRHERALVVARGARHRVSHAPSRSGTAPRSAARLAERRRPDRHLAPRGPRVPVDVRLDRRQDRRRVPHHAPADHEHLRVPRVDHRHRPRRPHPQAAVAHRGRDRVALGRAREDGLEVEPLAPGEGTRLEARRRPADVGQGPGRGLGLDAADAATGAGPALEVRHEVPAEDAGLRVLPAQEPALDHGHAADAGPERHHHHVVRALRRPRVAFAEEREARVVLDPEAQAERLAAPPRQVQPRRVVVLGVGGEHPARRRRPRGRRSRRRGRRSRPPRPRPSPWPGRSASAITGSAPASPRAASSDTVSTATTSRPSTTAQAAWLPPRSTASAFTAAPSPRPLDLLEAPPLRLRHDAPDEEEVQHAHRRVQPEGPGRADGLHEREEGGGHQDAGQPQAQRGDRHRPAADAGRGTAPRSPPRPRGRGPRRTRPRRAG